MSWPRVEGATAANTVTVPDWATAEMEMTEEITFYFKLGMSYKDIVRSLALRHGYVIKISAFLDFFCRTHI